MYEGQTISDNGMSWKVKNISKANNVTHEGTLRYPETPIGTIISYMINNDLLEGYLICNGAAVLRDDYPDLFNKLGTTFGVGDGSTTFNLPDLRNKFLEGSATAGTSVAAGLPNVYGYIGVCYGALQNYSSTRYGALYGGRASTTAANPSYGSTSYMDWLYINASEYNNIYGKSSTVQPPALTVVFLIKAYIIQ